MKNLCRIADQKLCRFLLVGIINTLVGTAIMFGLYNLVGLGYWFSSAANYILTSILSFFLNKYFTFQNREKSAAQVVRFAINIAICYLLAYGIAQPLCERILSGVTQVTVRDNISMLVGMCLFTGFNYLGQRFFTFRGKE